MPQTIHDLHRTMLDDARRRDRAGAAPRPQIAVAEGRELAPLPSVFPAARVVRHHPGYVAPAPPEPIRLLPVRRGFAVAS
jgi:hypothetical protein